MFLMEKRAVVLALALTLPLLLYGIPYAYAASTQSTYVMRGNFPVINSGATGFVTIQCASPTDFTQHYSVSNPEQFPVSSVQIVNSAGLTANNGENPNGWFIAVHNLSGGATFTITAQIICQSPLTLVAGIGVPEFGSLYVAIALGALVYFMLARHFTTRRPSTVSTQVKA
jgi:hypothetical protein